MKFVSDLSGVQRMPEATRYCILFLIALTLLLGVQLYRESNRNRFTGYPRSGRNVKVPLHLYYYYFGLDCDSCTEAVSYLNELNRSIPVNGVVVDSGIDRRRMKGHGIEFPVNSIGKAGENFRPGYCPSLVGVTGDGTVLFIQPGVPSYEKSNQLIYETLNSLWELKYNKIRRKDE